MTSFKKKTLAVACISPWLASSALGLGVGSVEVSSHLGAPLQAEIPLINIGDLNENQILIALASHADYERLSVDPLYFHQQLRFTPVLDKRSGTIRISTQMPVSEPYLNFVISVKWPGGSLLREYTLLLDPANPAAASNSPAAIAASSASTPAASSVQRRFESSTMTRAGDSLWLLAKRIPRPEGTNLAQVMNALYDANPQAFIKGDPNRLIAHTPIKAPEADAILQASRAFNPTAPAAQSAAPAKAQAVATPEPTPSQASTSQVAPATSGSSSTAANAELEDQLEGLKAGVAMAEAGKAKTRQDIEELEQELSILVARYKMLAQKTEAMERELAQRPVPATPAPGTTTATEQADAQPGTAIVSSAPTVTNSETQTSSNSVSWVWTGAIIGGALLGGYLLGHLIPVGQPTPRRPQPQRAAAAKPATSNRPAKAKRVLPSIPGLGKAATKGSATFENPFTEYDQDARDDASVVAGAYAAFGMTDQAEEALTQAILKEPERTDLKLQLLEVYAEANDQEGFDDLAVTLLESSQDKAVSVEIEVLKQQMGAGSDNDNVTDISTRLSVNQ